MRQGLCNWECFSAFLLGKDLLRYRVTEKLYHFLFSPPTIPLNLPKRSFLFLPIHGTTHQINWILFIRNFFIAFSPFTILLYAFHANKEKTNLSIVKLKFSSAECGGFEIESKIYCRSFSRMWFEGGRVLRFCHFSVIQVMPLIEINFWRGKRMLESLEMLEFIYAFELNQLKKSESFTFVSRKISVVTNIKRLHTLIYSCCNSAKHLKKSANCDFTYKLPRSRRLCNPLTL